MVERLIARLNRIGWENNEINKAIEIIQNAKAKKHPSIKLLDSSVYWILIAVIFIVNFGVSVAIVPLMMILNNPFIYFILIVLGFSFGLFFEQIIRSIEHLQKKHYVILVIVIPFAAIINLFVISGLRGGFYLVGIVYSFAFVLPYLFYKLVLKKGYYS